MEDDLVCTSKRVPCPRRLPFGALCAGLVLLLLAPSTSADEWVRVAGDGLGDPSRVQVDALAVHGADVVLASHEARSGGQSVLLRAEMREDHVWADDTPPWENPGEVSALEVVGGVLYAATTGGQLWRRGTGTSWSRVPRPWTGTPALLDLGTWDAPDGRGRLLCVLREGPSIACRKAGGAWTELPLAPLADPSSVESGRLVGFDGELLAGFGGGSEGSRLCELWRYAPAAGWSAVTTDGFADWHDAVGDLTWITDMVVFERRAYVGTGGHTTALLARVGPAGVEDVTPYDLYDCSSSFGECPLRYNALATTRSRVFVGTRTGGVGPPQADVLASDDGRTWTPSNAPGFGVERNDTVTAMGSRSVHVYVGVLNAHAGFQVWRRDVPFLELIPPLYEELWEARLAGAAVVRCLRPFLPCPPPWADLLAPIDEIRLTLTLARRDKEAPARVAQAAEAMDQVRQTLVSAEELGTLADKAPTPREARDLRARSARLVVRGLNQAARALHPLGPARHR